ncbi:type VI secretion system accessory protein TagJ [Rubinisphaera sp. JC750]|uniref:type VI secretion system accessory protein TagJ n=1 Tax=Rubinisphaera sp. JC750 TaxID=2898658 RepID=UPI001F481D9B|nr:type VI secretion system accessory protein TagJ [Rubinisphaera sp. JC750]
MSPIEHFEAGDLQQAIATALSEVKSHPTDVEKRMVLSQLFAFNGELERADKQLDIIGTQSPDAAVSVAEFRQLIRAAQSRHDFYASGALPEFLGEPTESQQLQLKASIALREGKSAEARALLDQAAEYGTSLTGVCDGDEFAGFRDLDDLLGTTIELLTSNGKYYWVPAERLISLNFMPIEMYHQLLWRRAEIEVQEGPTGVVHIPVTYANPVDDLDDQGKLGRMTDWRGTEDSPVLGVGQKTWLIGDSDRPLMSIESLSVNPSNA